MVESFLGLFCRESTGGQGAGRLESDRKVPQYLAGSTGEGGFCQRFHEGRFAHSEKNPLARGRAPAVNSPTLC
jgi:hypothetical protein